MRRVWIVGLYAALALGVAGLGAYLAVSLLVEQGTEVTVPAVTGLTLSEALDELAPADLDLEILAYEYSDLVPENHIVRQRPLPDRVVKSGRGVGVVVSRGPERHPIPDVRGLSEEDARILLGEAGLKGEAMARMHGPPRGEVVALGADPGTRLPRGATLPLVISSGPRPLRLRMPRLEGTTAEEALAELDRLGLRAARIEEVSLEDPTRRGRVVSQDPLPGFPVTRGEDVVISVAGTNTAGAALRGVWMSYTLPPGFGRHHVEVLVRESDRTWILADEWLAAGTAFRRWVPLTTGQVAVLRVDDQPILTSEDQP